MQVCNRSQVQYESAESATEAKERLEFYLTAQLL